jgi:hypothetical protein
VPHVRTRSIVGRDGRLASRVLYGGVPACAASAIRASGIDWRGPLVFLREVLEPMVGAMRLTAHERVGVARALDRIGGLVRPPAPDPQDAAGIPF